jgi:hypothetical protein
MSQGYRTINIHGEDLTAEKIYQTLSSGGYFEDDDAAADFVRGIMSTPIAGAFFWHQFYDYTRSGFGLASALFSLIVEIERSAKYKSRVARVKAAWRGRSRGKASYYCLQRY